MAARPSTLFLLVVILAVVIEPASANHAMIQRGRTVGGQLVPRHSEAIVVERESIEIDIKAPEKWTVTPLAKVHATYTMKNTSQRQEILELGFPVFNSPQAHSPLAFGLPASPKKETPKDWFSVTIDGKQVKVEQHALPDLVPDPERVRRRNERFAELLYAWSNDDPVLKKLLDKHKQLVAGRKRLPQLTEDFNSAVTAHLINPDETRYAAVQMAIGRGSIYYLIKMMPEVDEKLRYDVSYNRAPYVSILRDRDAQDYQSFEKKWREQVDRWLRSKADIAEILDDVRSAYDNDAQAWDLLLHDVANYLHDFRGLSVNHANELARFLGGGEANRSYPPLAVVEVLFPEAYRVVKEDQQRRKQALDQWGFDRSMLSPLTGRPYLNRHGWRDDSVAALLKLNLESADFSSRAGRQHSSWSRSREVTHPMLMRYQLSFAPGARHKVTVEYRTLMDFDENLYMGRSYAVITQLTYILKTVQFWKSFGPIDIKVNVPTAYHAVIQPVPTNVSSTQDGQTSHQMTLTGPKENLQIALVRLAEQFGSRHFSHFNDDEYLECDLQLVLDHVDHPAARPLLRAALIKNALHRGRRWEAWRDYLALKKELPTLPDIHHLVNSGAGSVDAEQVYEWIEAKGRKPIFATEDDFRRFKWDSNNDGNVLGPEDLTELAERMRALDESQLSVEQRMGRHFVFCHAEIKLAKNLRQLVALAEAESQSRIHALTLIQHLPPDKTAALDFVLKQIDVEHQRRPRGQIVKDRDLQNAAYSAMRTFHSEAAAARLIDLIRRTDSSLLIQGAVFALRGVESPKFFDDLVSLWDKAGGASGSANSYLTQTLIKIDRPRAIEFLWKRYMDRPKAAPTLLLRLAELGDQRVLPLAIEIYNSASDTQAISYAANAIYDLADASVFEKIRYRRGMPQHVHSPLIALCRKTGGGTHAFRFAESYYHEFVEGNETRHFGDLVDAFEKIGDPRAIPYLEKILFKTERKLDAAGALGHLTLRLPFVPQEDDDFDLWRLWRTAQDLKASGEQRDAAVKKLLERPQQVVDAVLRYNWLADRMRSSEWHPWTNEERQRFEFFREFGTTGMSALLNRAEGCKLVSRRNLAEAMSTMPDETFELLREAVRNSKADLIQRRAAMLALALAKDSQSRDLIDSLRDDPKLGRNAADALARFGDAK